MANRKRCEPVPTRRAAKGTGCRFRPPFLWFVSFGGAKEMNIKIWKWDKELISEIWESLKINIKQDCSPPAGGSRSVRGDPTKRTMPQLSLLSFFVFKTHRKHKCFLAFFKQKMLLAEHCSFCDPDRIQTCNLLIRSQMLYSVKLRDPLQLCGCKYSKIFILINIDYF